MPDPGARASFDLRQALKDAASTGTTLAVHARLAPERLAVRSAFGQRSYGELNARCNRLARALRARGLRPGDAIALLCSNRVEFAEVLYAGMRSGLRVTPINHHLTGPELAYVVENCEARVFFADARYAEAAGEAAAELRGLDHRVAIAGDVADFEPYEEAFAASASHDLEDPVLGSTMLYTSGTTGRPKGVYRRATPPARLGAPVLKAAAINPDQDCALCTGPLYHAAPLAFNLAVPLQTGLSVHLMDRFDAEETLRLVEKHRISHTHMVPTMFHRLLALPPEVRAGYDISSLRFVLHGAAPCPVHVKRELIEWLGPVVYEYYAATEGGGTFIGSEEWMRKPGSVGRPVQGESLVVLSEEGEPLPPEAVGTVYIRAPEVGRFEYFKAREKTDGAYRGDLFTMGDLGYFDRDGYLFLTGRSAELIISGGVNIYPAEVDAILLMHRAVADAATIGIPDEEWGESVKTVVALREGAEPSTELAEALRLHCREHLAHYKCPRTIDFSSDLPRSAAGKIQRHKVRARYLQPS
ncbi:MAG: AMP-binding protein [Myxococcota bacterium]